MDSISYVMSDSKQLLPSPGQSVLLKVPLCSVYLHCTNPATCDVFVFIFDCKMIKNNKIPASSDIEEPLKTDSEIECKDTVYNERLNFLGTYVVENYIQPCGIFDCFY